MQYGIPNCLSHIPNPVDTVPSAPIDLFTDTAAILNQLNVFHFQHIEVIELFTDTAAILNLLDLRSIRGHSVSIYARFSGKKRT